MKRHMKYFMVLLVVAVIFIGIMGSVRMNEIREVTAMETAPITVVVDAGHGGMDGGATAPSGVLESKLNLEIAQRVNDFLVLCGFQTTMIRDTDVSIHDDSATTISQKKVSDLKNRVKIVNETPNAVLISIHQNMFPEEKYSGAQVFHTKTEDGAQWAKIAQQALIGVVDPNNHREAKQSSKVYLMENIQCDGILVECGFLSNKRESAMLQEPSYQKKIAVAVVGSLAQWQLEGQNNDEI